MSSILPEPEVCYLTDLRSEVNPKRKLNFRWELARVDGSHVVVNTQLANKVARKLLLEHAPLRGLLKVGQDATLQSEVSLNPSEGVRTRFDFAFQELGEPVYIEVKQVSLRASDDATGRRWAAFPDAVTQRGRRHLEELTKLRGEGFKTALLYIVGRDDVDAVRPAHEVDPAYAASFKKAKEAGVQMVACRVKADTKGLSFDRFIPVDY